MTKKAIPLLLVLLIAASAVLTVSAETTYADTQNITDLLVANSYTYDGWSISDEDTPDVEFCDVIGTKPYFDVCSHTSANGETEFYYYSDISYLSMSWTPVNMTLCSTIYFYISIANADSVSIYINGTKVPANWTGFNGNYYGYYVEVKRQLISSIRVEFSSDENFTSTPGVVSCFTNSTITGDLNNGDFEAYGYLYDKYDLDPSVVTAEKYYDVPLEKEADANSFIPSIELVSNYSDNGNKVLTQLRLHFVFDVYAYASMNAIDYCTFTMQHAGAISDCSAYVGSSWEEESPDDVSVDVTRYYSDFGEVAVSNMFYDYECYGSTLFVDMRGVDLKTTRYLHVEIAIDPISYSYEADDKAVFWKMFNATYSYDVSTDLTPTLIISNLEMILKRLGLTLSTLSEFFDLYSMQSYTIIAKLDQILENFSVSESEQQQVTSGSGSVTDQSSQLSGMVQEFDDVDRPDINFGDMIANIGGIEFGAMPTNVLGVITYNKYIYPLLLFVFVGTLGAYLIFGKR